MTLQFAKHQAISLKGHPQFHEAWLHDRICEDTSILGLGELDVIQRERVQQSGGRLDMLLYDAEGETRYEVEIMLGATDPSHIVRSIEYWDVERRRYPGYDHVAVLIAEEITSRYYNVISLMSGTIPMVAIQVNALQVGDTILLDFVKVHDQRALRTDDTVETGGDDIDRATWETRVGAEMMSLADQALGIINEVADPQLELKYKKRHIGICEHQAFFNVGIMWPKKSFLGMKFALDDPEPWISRFEEAGLDCSRRKSRVVILKTRKGDFTNHEDLIRDFLHFAVKEKQSS